MIIDKEKLIQTDININLNLYIYHFCFKIKEENMSLDDIYNNLLDEGFIYDNCEYITTSVNNITKDSDNYTIIDVYARKKND